MEISSSLDVLLHAHFGALSEDFGMKFVMGGITDLGNFLTCDVNFKNVVTVKVIAGF